MIEKFKKTRLFAVLSRNTLPKLVCLALAITTWFIVMDNKNPVLKRTFRDVPVEIIGLTQIEQRGLIEEEILGDKVDVTVSGTWRNIVKVNSADLRLSVNLDGRAMKGKNKLPIERRILFPGVDIISLSHEDVEIQLDAIETVAKPVKISPKGELGDGLELGKIEFKEKEVEVQGASHLLRKIASIEGQVDVQNLSKSEQVFVNLYPMDAEGNPVEEVDLLKPNIAIDVKVLTSKSVPVIVLDQGEPKLNHRLTDKIPSLENIVIKGDTAILEGINEVRSKPINIEGLFQPFESKLELDLPPGVTASYEGPLVAKINIQALEKKSFFFKYKDVTFQNSNENYSYVYDAEKKLTLEVRDIISVIKNIKDTDIKLTLDVGEVTLGTYAINIKVDGLPESTVYTIPDFELNVIEKGSEE